MTSPLPQTGFRTENIKFIHTASFSCDRFPSYDFSANLTSHVQSSIRETYLCNKNFSESKSFQKPKGERYERG